MKDANDIIAAPLKHFRARVATGIDRVDRTGGRFGFGVVRGVSVILRKNSATSSRLLWQARSYNSHAARLPKKLVCDSS